MYINIHTVKHITENVQKKEQVYQSLDKMKYGVNLVILILISLMFFMGASQQYVPWCCRYGGDCCKNNPNCSCPPGTSNFPGYKTVVGSKGFPVLGSKGFRGYKTFLDATKP